MIVLCIDDDPDDTDFFCEALKTVSPESQCLVANDGLTALKMLRSDSSAGHHFSGYQYAAHERQRGAHSNKEELQMEPDTHYYLLHDHPSQGC